MVHKSNVASIMSRRVWLDELMVVRNSTITIEGLNPGYEVRIIDSSGNVIYDKVATGSVITINMYDIGISQFPLNATIEVVRS